MREHHTSPEETQRFHGERVEARQRQNAPSNDALKKILNDITGGKPDTAADVTVNLLGELLSGGSVVSMIGAAQLREMAAVAAILKVCGFDRPKSYSEAKALAVIVGDAIGLTIEDLTSGKSEAELTAKAAVKTAPAREHLGQEGILSAIDAQPVFIAFWQKLNDERAARGEAEAGYGDAKKAFLGGETPTGAMTFVGKDWDGLRAVPAQPVKYLGGQRPTYHGEYREVSESGTVWHKVLNKHEHPIAYALPEAALVAAKDRRAETVAPANH